MTTTIASVRPATPQIVAVPDWRRAARVVRRIILVAVVGLGTAMLVRQAPTLGRGLLAAAHANPVGLMLTGLLGAMTYVAAAVAITAASGRSLRFGRTAAVQLAAACTNRIAPAGLGGMATNICYLQHDGATRGEAVAAVGVTSVASFVVHLVATMSVLGLVHRSTAVPSVALPGPVPLAAGLLVVAGVVTLLARRTGPRLKAKVAEVWSAVTPVCADRRRLGRLFLGTIGVTLGHGLAFAAAVAATGVHLPIAELLAVFLAGSAVGSTAPTPGGLGALEAALVAGLMTFGVAATPAVAGVLIYRLVTYWLPILPGAVALRILRRDILVRA